MTRPGHPLRSFLVWALIGLLAAVIVSAVVQLWQLETRVKAVCHPYAVEMYNNTIVVCRVASGYELRTVKGEVK
jgi:hypothetical protein